ncbi:hypothetical protein SCHPADRAFT_897082 [Schizopora paradoxa]|uniref:Uncharacterized protein n=1 Tax=Schizopora paradoxa TaxID=27342 RepID=A0A0H2QZG1_9AGAM|nr:hypothetical protein SCHPADRAFT_897082 [Schizopora paradoxa]
MPYLQHNALPPQHPYFDPLDSSNKHSSRISGLSSPFNMCLGRRTVGGGSGVTGGGGGGDRVFRSDSSLWVSQRRRATLGRGVVSGLGLRLDLLLSSLYYLLSACFNLWRLRSFSSDHHHELKSADMNDKLVEVVCLDICLTRVIRQIAVGFTTIAYRCITHTGWYSANIPLVLIDFRKNHVVL